MQALRLKCVLLCCMLARCSQVLKRGSYLGDEGQICLSRTSIRAVGRRGPCQISAFGGDNLCSGRASLSSPAVKKHLDRQHRWRRWHCTGLDPAGDCRGCCCSNPWDGPALLLPPQAPAWHGNGECYSSEVSPSTVTVPSAGSWQVEEDQGTGLPCPPCQAKARHLIRSRLLVCPRGGRGNWNGCGPRAMPRGLRPGWKRWISYWPEIERRPASGSLKPHSMQQKETSDGF